MSELGEFLRARRAGLTPERLGLASHGRRRVAGLRREEVAVLAGVNADYYARLEQGRERNPSAQVVEALGAALRLDDAARAHLYRLAGVTREDAEPASREVDPALARLLAGYAHTPAFVLGPALDLLTANALARALFSPFERLDNLARMTFLDPAARDFHRDWDQAAWSTVAALRHATGPHPRDARLAEVVAELSGASTEFARRWLAHGVAEKAAGTKELRHPEAGPLSLGYQTFDVRGAHGQQVVVYHAEPGSPSSEALAVLARGTFRSVTGRAATGR